MRNLPLYATIGMFFYFFTLNAQSPSPISGYWKISSESSPLISFLHTYQDDDMIGFDLQEGEELEIVPPRGIKAPSNPPVFERLWKFSENGYLFTRDVNWRIIAMPYEAKAGLLILPGRGQLEIVERTDQKLTLYSTALDTFRLTRLKNKTDLFDHPEYVVSQKRAGNFRCDGVYHYKLPEGSPGMEPNQYAGLDLRFYPDSTLIFSYSENAPDVDPESFQVFTHRGGVGVLPFPFDKIHNIKIERNEGSVKDQVMGFNIQYTFKLLDDGLEWMNQVFDQNGNPLESKTLAFEFFPLDGLTYYFELEND